MCKFSGPTDSFSSPVTGNSYKILGTTSCRTNNCIYLISCKQCQKQYVGETGDLRRGINNHRSTIKTKRITEPVAEHFNLDGHKWEDMTVIVIDHNPRWSDSEQEKQRKILDAQIEIISP
jgi:hypothetical protein